MNGDFNDSGRGAPEDERFRPFDNLPNELIEHIFRFGTAPDIVSWRTVSGRWNGLANDSVPGRVIRFQVAMGFLGTVIDSETRQLLEDIFREKGIHAYPDDAFRLLMDILRPKFLEAKNVDPTTGPDVLAQALRDIFGVSASTETVTGERDRIARELAERRARRLQGASVMRMGSFYGGAGRDRWGREKDK